MTKNPTAFQGLAAMAFLTKLLFLKKLPPRKMFDFA